VPGDDRTAAAFVFTNSYEYLPSDTHTEAATIAYPSGSSPIHHRKDRDSKKRICINKNVTPKRKIISAIKKRKKDIWHQQKIF